MRNPAQAATQKEKESQARKDNESAVELAVEVYVRVRQRKAGGKDGASLHLRKQYIHKQPRNKYFKVFLKAYNWLQELRGDHTNPMEHLLQDYFTMIFDYMAQFGRVANTSQMSPSSANQVRFLDWITDWESRVGENYWRLDGKNITEIREEAHQSIISANQAKQQLIESARSHGANVDIEIGTARIGTHK